MSEQPRHEDWCPCSQLIGAPMDDGESAEMGAFAWPADACVCGAVPVAPPLPAGPVAPPPESLLQPICGNGYHFIAEGDTECACKKAQADSVAPSLDLGTLLDDLTWLLSIVEQDLRSHHRHRSDPFNTCSSPMCVRYREIRDRKEALKGGEAPRGAARPPQPDLHAECHDIVCNGSRDKPRGEGDGCSCRTRAEREFEELLALRAVVESAARPPASQPALEASVRELVENYTKSGGCGWCGGLPHSSGCLVGRMERALAVPPEAPPP